MFIALCSLSFNLDFHVEDALGSRRNSYVQMCRCCQSARLRMNAAETWRLEVQFDRESSVCGDSFMQSGDAD
ncbi:hypothetical protein Bca101_059004 [Brassica carinata]